MANPNNKPIVITGKRQVMDLYCTPNRPLITPSCMTKVVNPRVAINDKTNPSTALMVHDI